MSTLRDGVARARCEREAQGRRCPEAADQDGTATQEDDPSTTSKRHVERADGDDITSKDVTPTCFVCFPCMMTCLLVLKKAFLPILVFLLVTFLVSVSTCRSCFFDRFLFCAYAYQHDLQYPSSLFSSDA